MRLLIVTQYFWPENFRVNDLAAELKSRGHEVTVLTGLPNYPEGEVFEDFSRDSSLFKYFAGAEIVRVPVLPRRQGKLHLALNYASFALSASTLGIWKLRGRSFDAIFAFQTSPISQAIPAVLLRRLKRAPMLMWVLDAWPDTLSAVGIITSRKVLGLMGRVVRFVYRHCDRILVQSHAFAENVRTYGEIGKMRYFPNWPEPVFTEAQTTLDNAPELVPYAEDFKLLFAGNLGTAQDLPSVLKAADILRHEPHLRWLIVGDGRAAATIREEIGRLHLEEKVKLLGRLPLDRMPSLLGAADAVFVSLEDRPIFASTIPGKVQSYLAAGKPVVAMLNGEGARIIQEAGAGLVAPAGQPDAFAQRVREMMEMSAEQRLSMGRAGMEYCKREFSRTMLFDRLERWLEEAKQDNEGGP